MFTNDVLIYNTINCIVFEKSLFFDFFLGFIYENMKIYKKKIDKIICERN